MKLICPGVLDCARGLATGAFSATELADRILSNLDAAPFAFISFDAGAFKMAAAQSDARRRAGYTLGPLDGVPVAIKDNIDVAGQVTTAGAALRRNELPANADAAIVAKLKRAGALIAGKTNLSEFAFSGIGSNPHFGTPHLPGRPDKAPGGSSSGSGVAVAAGLVAAAVGTDTAGSVRIPAAFNGIVGYRASRVRYEMDGVFPLAPSFDTLGLLVRSVNDAAMLDAVVVGSSAYVPSRGSAAQTLVYDPSVLPLLTLSPDVARSYEDYVERLSAAGFRIAERQLDFLADTILQLQSGWPGSFEASELLGSLSQGAEQSELDPLIKARLLAARGYDRTWYEEMMNYRRQLQSDVQRELKGQIMLLPTVSHLAPGLGQLLENPEAFAVGNLSALRLTMIGSFLDMPTLAVPTGPLGGHLEGSVSMMAPSGMDGALLATGCEIERRLGRLSV